MSVIEYKPNGVSKWTAMGAEFISTSLKWYNYNYYSYSIQHNYSFEITNNNYSANDYYKTLNGTDTYYKTLSGIVKKL